jgi:hypothetical protein
MKYKAMPGGCRESGRDTRDVHHRRGRRGCQRHAKQIELRSTLGAASNMRLDLGGSRRVEVIMDQIGQCVAQVCAHTISH